MHTLKKCQGENTAPPANSPLRLMRIGRGPGFMPVHGPPGQFAPQVDAYWSRTSSDSTGLMGAGCRLIYVTLQTSGDATTDLMGDSYGPHRPFPIAHLWPALAEINPTSTRDQNITYCHIIIPRLLASTYIL
jgi:hypothetical protein